MRGHGTSAGRCRAERKAREEVFVKQLRKMLIAVAGTLIAVSAAAGAGYSIEHPTSPATGCNQTVQVS